MNSANAEELTELLIFSPCSQSIYSQTFITEWLSEAFLHIGTNTGTNVRMTVGNANTHCWARWDFCDWAFVGTPIPLDTLCQRKIAKTSSNLNPVLAIWTQGFSEPEKLNKKKTPSKQSQAKTEDWKWRDQNHSDLSM